MICQTCSFETERLLVGAWHAHAAAGGLQKGLERVVANLLTAAVTRTLPPSWQGDYPLSRARAWIAERDNDGTTLLVMEKSSRQPVGLVILHEVASQQSDDGIEVRLGYLLAEPVWGQGLATELVRGLVGWCRRQDGLTALAGGVDADHPASMRVLERNGFRPVEDAGETGQGPRLFRLALL